MFHELIYTSTARPDVNISGIISAAVIKNKRFSVTGLLIFDGTYFMQLLEGDATSVEYIFHRICRDARHENISVQSRKTVLDRSFEQCPMKYCDKIAGEIHALANNTPIQEDDAIARMTARRIVLQACDDV